ncbi:unnamed protein product [Brachionus calyciflorus]|uniref:Uncharacterized protein n=1 Tax=Brachionus calyciflorus TaxID=104777 RepID=A0A814D4I1_9BILA|nr:unnamed protein product [Brachionus calyciflorus]
MLRKSFIPIVCLLIIIQSKFSFSYIPFLTDEEQLVNNLAEPEEESETQNEEIEYFDKIAKLEDNLNQEQEKFIHKYIIKDTPQPQALPVLNDEKGQSGYIYIEFDRDVQRKQIEDLLKYIAEFSAQPLDTFKELSIKNNLILFRAECKNMTLNSLVNKILKYQIKILKEKGLEILGSGLVDDGEKAKFDAIKKSQQTKEILIIFGIVSLVALSTLLILVFIAYMVKKRFFTNNEYFDGKKSLDDEECLIHNESSNSSKWLAYVPFYKPKKNNLESPCQEYQDLCRQRMHSKVSPINPSVCTSITNAQTPALPSPANNCQVVNNSNTINSTPIRITDSNQSRNASWLEESMCHFNIDITTGHVILSYMEKYLNDKDLINKEWNYLTEYVPDENSTYTASQMKNYKRNRYEDRLPYDYSLVKLRNAEESDYINASYIIDDDPKNPAYIAAQSPLQETASEFWQMLWDNQTVVIVNLSNKMDTDKSYQYWPDKGSKIYNKYEIQLASEHIWNDDFLVRNFFFKNIETDKTRTVTQYQYLSWQEDQVPCVKSFLDFRRKVNKSYTSKTCPIVVHCNDGMGRTGTFILIDMVLNKIGKDVKEIDLAATLEFLRDQRPHMIRHKNQYEFSFEVIIHEIKNYLNHRGN